MANLWLIPTDEHSYQQTLADPVDLTPAPDKPSSFPDNARVWGVRTDPEHPDAPWDRNEQNLERMSPGDPLVIYRNSESRYVATGYIGGPIWHTGWVRDSFWGGGPALDIFYTDQWQPIDMEPEALNKQLGYEENFVPQGLWRVADSRPIERAIQHIENETDGS